MTTRMSWRMWDEAKDQGPAWWGLVEAWKRKTGRRRAACDQSEHNWILTFKMIQSPVIDNSSNSLIFFFQVTSAERSWPVQRPFHGGPTSFDPFLSTSSFEPFLNWKENIFFGVFSQLKIIFFWPHLWSLCGLPLSLPPPPLPPQGSPDLTGHLNDNCSGKDCYDWVRWSCSTRSCSDAEAML